MLTPCFFLCGIVFIGGVAYIAWYKENVLTKVRIRPGKIILLVLIFMMLILCV